jgi:membrane protein YdbS with pleckstrin-like domain
MDPAEPVASPAPTVDPVPSVADGVTRPLDPRYVDLHRQIGWIASGIISAAAVVGTTVFLLASRVSWSGSAFVVIAVFVLLALLGWWLIRWPPIEYRYMSYRVDADGLEIRTGVYFRSVVTVPRTRVQHTDVSQGPLQRRYGLATLTVHTAGTENAEVTLPGLPHETALRIRDHLLPGNTADAV